MTGFLWIMNPLPQHPDFMLNCKIFNGFDNFLEIARLILYTDPFSLN